MKLFILSTLLISFSINAACIGNKKSVDANCACKRNNTCFKYESAKNKKWYNSVFKSKVSKQLLKVKYDSDKLIEKLFTGELSPYDPALDKMYTKYDKIEKIKNKGMKKYEANLKKRGVKRWKVSNRVNSIKKVYKNLKGDKSLITEMNKVTGSKLNIRPQINIREQIAKSKKTQSVAVNKESATESANTKKEQPKDTIASKDSIKQAQLQADRMRKKNFKFDTIIKDRDKSIFEFISSRYQRLKSKLDIKVNTPLPAKDREILLDFMNKQLKKS